MECNNNCSCANAERNFPCMNLGYAYVLPQIFTNLHSLDNAISRGTLFKDLDIPITEYGK